MKIEAKIICLNVKLQLASYRFAWSNMKYDYNFAVCPKKIKQFNNILLSYSHNPNGLNVLLELVEM